MPRVDEIPLATTSTMAPGWAYVPDTGFDPSKTALNPTQGRNQRAARTAAQPSIRGGSTAELSARQQAAIQRHLAELDRDNFKEVPVPQASRSMEKLKGKTTAVKKILLSQKTFAYHLSDEEAWQSQQPAQPPPASIATSRAVSVTPAAATAAAPARPGKVPKGRRSMPNQDVEVTPAPPAAEAANTAEVTDEEPTHPLLVQTDALTMPSSEELEALFDAPMLPYVAAKVKPPDPNGPAPRKFCEMCGYWGPVRCMKCGARVCGLECRLKHDESRCQRFFA